MSPPERASSTLSKEKVRQSLLDLFRAYPILEQLLKHLRIVDVITLTRTCEPLSHLYQTLLELKPWNVDHDLLRFVKDPRGLREQLGKHDALISGSFALQFFERVCWEESDLDIYVEQGEGATQLTRYLKKVEGYQYKENSFDCEYEWGVRTDIRTYTKPESDTTSAQQIQVIAPRCAPLKFLLEGFHSTTVMNVLTWNKAYALYPQCTFVLNSGVALRDQDMYFDSHAEKYRGRQYPISVLEEVDKRRSLREMTQIRRPGDSLTWKVPFDTSGITPPAKPDFVFEHCSFGFVDKASSGDDRRDDEEYAPLPYCITAEDFESCVLKYHYTRPNHDDFFNGIKWTLDNLTRQELQKLPKERRPRCYDEMLENDWGLQYYRRQLTNRDGSYLLNFYDEKIPEWYADWEKSSSRYMKACLAPEGEYFEEDEDEEADEEDDEDDSESDAVEDDKTDEKGEIIGMENLTIKD